MAIDQYNLPKGKILGLCVAPESGCTLGEEVSTPYRIGRWGSGLRVWEWAQCSVLLSLDLWQNPQTQWLAVEYDAESVTVRGKEIRVSKWRAVCHSAEFTEVIKFIQKHTPEEKRGPVLFEVKEVDEGDVTVGAGGTATVRGSGTAIAGDYGTARAGTGGIAEVGDGGYAKVEYAGTARAGIYGKAEAGMYGTAIAGDSGTAIAGDGGTAEVGDGGKAKVGDRGTIVFLWYGDDELEPYLLRFYVGDGGLKPDTFYKLDGSGNPVETQ